MLPLLLTISLFSLSDTLFPSISHSFFVVPQRQRLIRNRSSGDSGSGVGDTPGQENSGPEGVPWGLENGDPLESETQPLEDPRTRGEGTALERVADMEDAQPKEEEDDDEAEEGQPFSPLIVPG